MKSLNILHVEDEPNHRLLVDTMLSISSLDYTLEAAETRKEALEKLDKVAEEATRPYDVVLLDANLESQDKDGSDGRTIVMHMQRLGLTARVIGVSAERMTEYGIPVDYDLGKQRLSEVADVIEELMSERA